ncbi:hypothetical protein Lac2_09750 [Claveliimonas bilis]|uniref:DUF3841 domain-containing protein n=1 Tax=Claveliimonas bilis TaxID=3028070 RepID=UPI002930AED6|nr:DUF3841 domain-containing protein [Claveliimonas bilis]BDZ82841.1 hypothetical protein Lac2_09750 [Claveliimonas bilis]
MVDQDAKKGSGGEMVRLYTRQNDKTLYQLERDGRIINQRVYVELHFGDIAPLFMESYDWFTEEAARRVEKPADVHAPIWCSISRENCLKPIEGTVVYILEVPAEKIIYFDEGKWDYVLNRIYLPKDEMDRQEYKQHLKDIGVVNGFEFFQGRYAGKYPQEEARIKESWLRVFEIDNWTIFNVCGNIWEIRKEWVKQIVHPGEAVV